MATLNDLHDLLKKASRFVQNNCTTHLSKWLFHDLMPVDKNTLHQHIGEDNRVTLTPKLKDVTGHRNNPTNSTLKGVLLTIHTDLEVPTGFDPHHVLVPMAQLFAGNFYFSDFYCMNVGRPHYVQLIVAPKDSEADRFCKEHLPQLDAKSNPFLIVEKKHGSAEFLARYPGQDYLSNLFIEVFYADVIEVNAFRDEDSTCNKRLPRSQHCSVCE